MTRKITIIASIVIFVLIICSSYSLNITKVKGDETDNYAENMESVTGDIVYSGKYLIPVENFIAVTSSFGKREAHGVVNSNHTGIDLVGKTNSNILNIDVGEVTYAGWQRGYGNCIEIKHRDEAGNIFYSFYAHMQDNSIKVIVGQQVELGQIIGVQGTTGNSTGDHLHFEIRLEDKTKIDPAPYLFTLI